jgi:hypothetical protein
MARAEYDLELRRYNGRGLARDLFSERFSALADVTCRRCLGEKPVGGGAAGGARCARQARTRRRSAAGLDTDRRIASLAGGPSEPDRANRPPSPPLSESRWPKPQHLRSNACGTALAQYVYMPKVRNSRRR